MSLLSQVVNDITEGPKLLEEAVGAAKTAHAVAADADTAVEGVKTAIASNNSILAKTGEVIDIFDTFVTEVANDPDVSAVLSITGKTTLATAAIDVLNGLKTLINDLATAKGATPPATLTPPLVAPAAITKAEPTLTTGLISTGPLEPTTAAVVQTESPLGSATVDVSDFTPATEASEPPS